MTFSDSALGGTALLLELLPYYYYYYYFEDYYKISSILALNSSARYARMNVLSTDILDGFIDFTMDSYSGVNGLFVMKF